MAASLVERMKPSLYQQHLQHIGNTASLYSDFRCPDPSCCRHHKPLMDVFDHPWVGNGGHPLMEFHFGMQNRCLGSWLHIEFGKPNADGNCCRNTSAAKIMIVNPCKSYEMCRAMPVMDTNQSEGPKDVPRMCKSWTRRVLQPCSLDCSHHRASDPATHPNRRHCCNDVKAVAPGMQDIVARR